MPPRSQREQQQVLDDIARILDETARDRDHSQICDLMLVVLKNNGLSLSIPARVEYLVIAVASAYENCVRLEGIDERLIYLYELMNNKQPGLSNHDWFRAVGKFYLQDDDVKGFINVLTVITVTSITDQSPLRISNAAADFSLDHLYWLALEGHVPRPDEAALILLLHGSSLDTLATKQEPAIFRFMRLVLLSMPADEEEPRSFDILQTFFDTILRQQERNSRNYFEELNNIGENIFDFIHSAENLPKVVREEMMSFLQKYDIHPVKGARSVRHLLDRVQYHYEDPSRQWAIISRKMNQTDKKPSHQVSRGPPDGRWISGNDRGQQPRVKFHPYPPDSQRYGFLGTCLLKKMKKKHPRAASLMYTKAIELLNISKQNKADLAVLYNNRARAYMDVREYVDALHDAERAIEIKKNYANVYLKYAEICRLSCEYAKGIRKMIEFLKIPRVLEEDRVKIATKAVIYMWSTVGMPEMKLVERHWSDLVQSISSPSTMRKTILSLSNDGHWKALKSLLRYITPTNTTHSMLAGDVNLRGLAEKNEDWCIHLVYELLTHGAGIQTLGRDGEPVIFTIVRMAVQAPWASGTFREIIEQFLSDEELCATNQSGQNAWDYATNLAKAPRKTKDCANVLDVLKQKGLAKPTENVIKKHLSSKTTPVQTTGSTRSTTVLGNTTARSAGETARASNGVPMRTKQLKTVEESPKQKTEENKSPRAEDELTCERCKKRYNLSTQPRIPHSIKTESLFEILKEKTHPPNTHDDWVKKSIASLANSTLPFPNVTIHVRELPDECYVKLLMACRKKWDVFARLVEPILNDDRKKELLEPVTTEMDLCEYTTSRSASRDTLKILLDAGLSPTKQNKRGERPLQTAAKSGQYGFVKLMVLYVTDPSTGGESPLHAALQGAQRKDGNDRILSYLLGLHRKNPNKYPFLSPAQARDAKGGTLLHAVAKINNASKERLKELTTMLTKCGINKDSKDKFDKRAVDYVVQSDNRYHLLQVDTSATATIPENEEPPNSVKTTSGSESQHPRREEDKSSYDRQSDKGDNHSHVDSSTAENVSNEATTLKTRKPVYERQQSRREKEDSINKEVMNRIAKMEQMPGFAADSSAIVESEEEDSDSIPEDYESDEQEEYLDDDSDAELSVEEDEEDAEVAATENPESSEENALLRPPEFTNLEWQVEISSNAWKTMVSKKFDKSLKEKIFRYIRELADGSLRPVLHKTVKIPESVKADPDLTLEKMNISKSARVIWEKAITPVTSDKKESNEGLYTEVIRIWAIVLDHGNIYRNVVRIARAISRGKSSIVERNLRPLTDKTNIVNGRQYPRHFTDNVTESCCGGTKWHPPASHRQNTYSIEKFYDCDRHMVEFFFDGIGEDGDFPFKPTPQEKKYIMLKPNPRASVLVLGRSGTGKTTCCLYRLWTRFKAYRKKNPFGAEAVIQRKTPLPEIEEEIEGDEMNMREENYQPAEEPDETSVTSSTAAVHDHLHQLFVTRNSGLVADVSKDFKKFCKARKETRPFGGSPNVPDKFQSVEDGKFPLFLNSHHLLIALDNSLPDPYFERDNNGNMIESIDGWRVSDIEDDSYVTVIQEDTKRKEVTYEIFHDEFWPKFGKLRHNFHPALVWMEIVSYIKGSFDALQSDKGYLTQEEYEQFGQKRAPTFRGNRHEIYDIFLRYQDQCRWKGYFDEADVVYHIYQRLVKYDHRSKWAIHEIYVDEVQDFTQAQLCLLIQMCQNPNDLFFTGDTAQSITRGVAFRFCDLRSLFHDLNEKELERKQEEARRREENGLSPCKIRHQVIRTPSDNNKLLYNYRSHDGVIRLAASVIDLLARYFPESFDRTEPDRALFDGPRPLVFDLDSVEDLVRKLRGGKSDGKRLNLGHEQCIIVQNELARENMREEFKNCQILTVIRTKGLEYDDILLYNFFKDSEVGETWRVVAEYLEELRQHQVPGPKKLDEIPEKDRSRPLKFDTDKHKILNSELKRLYTAITRARNRVWIYDEDPDTRKPVLEYFRALKLVTIVSEESHPKIEDLQKESTPKEWRNKGREHFRAKNYDVAAQCFRQGSDWKMAKICEAYHKIAKVRDLRSEADRSAAFFEAAAEILQGDTGYYKLYVEAARCLQLANQPQLAARLFKCLGKLKEAAELFDKSGNAKAAIECYEEIDHYDKVVDIYLRSNFSEQQYHEATGALSRYTEKLKRFEMDVDRKKILEAHRPTRQERHLRYKLAHHKIAINDTSGASEELEKLEWSNEEIVDFLVKKGKRNEAVNILKSKENFVEAAKMYRETGDYIAAIDTLKNSKCKETEAVKRELADCFVLHCRVHLEERKNEDQNQIGSVVNETVTKHKENLNSALENYRFLHLRPQQAECLLLKGILSQDVESLKKSQQEYRNERIDIGEIHAYIQLSKLSILPMGKFYVVLRSLSRALTTIEDVRSEVHHDLLRFYGAEETVEYGSPIHSLGANIGPLDKDNAENMIRKDLERLAKNAIERVLKTCNENLKKATPCSKLTECKASDCPYLHRRLDLDQRAILVKFHVDQMTLHGVLLDYYSKKNILVHFLKLKEKEGLIDWQCPMQLIRKLVLIPPIYSTDPSQIDTVMKPLLWNKNRDDFAPRKWLMILDDKSASVLVNLASNTTQLLKILYGLLISGEFIQRQHLRVLLVMLNNVTERAAACNFVVSRDYYYNVFKLCVRWLLEHYVDVDPFKSHKTLNCYLSVVAQRSARSPSLSPETEMVMPILEFQLARAILLLQKAKWMMNKTGSSYLPQGYLKGIELFDRCFRTKETLNIIHQYVIKNPWTFSVSVEDHLSILLQIVTGIMTKTFDLLSDAINVQNSKVQGRVIIFILTGLINIEETIGVKFTAKGKEMTVYLQEVIMQRLQQIATVQALHPLIRDFLDVARRGRGYVDLAEALRKFIEASSDKMIEIKWKPDSIFRSYPAKNHVKDLSGKFKYYDAQSVSVAYRLFQESTTEIVAGEPVEDLAEFTEQEYEVQVEEEVEDDPAVHDDGCIVCGDKALENMAVTEWKRHHIKSEKHMKAKTQHAQYIVAIEPLEKRVKEKIKEVRRLFQLVKDEEPDVKILSTENLFKEFTMKQREIEKGHKWSALQQLREIAERIDKDHKARKKRITSTNTYKEVQSREPSISTLLTTINVKPAKKQSTGESDPTTQTTSSEGIASSTMQKPTVVAVSSMDASTWTANNKYYKDNVYGRRLFIHDLGWNEPFHTMQIQGDSNMCGVCALNNLLQFEDHFRDYLELVPIEMDQLADDIWLQLISDHGGESTAAEGMRSTLGDYNIEVLKRAVLQKGFRLDRLTPVNCACLKNEATKWKVLVKVPGKDHYVSYNCNFGTVDKYDSMTDFPMDMIQTSAAEEIYEAMKATDGGAWLLLRDTA